MQSLHHVMVASGKYYRYFKPPSKREWRVAYRLKRNDQLFSVIVQLVCVVIPIFPRTVTVPNLGVFHLFPLFTLTVTDPVPLDDVGNVEIPFTLSDDLHVQTVAVVNETEPIPPALGNAPQGRRRKIESGQIKVKKFMLFGFFRLFYLAFSLSSAGG